MNIINNFINHDLILIELTIIIIHYLKLYFSLILFND